jgi:hypothetical protein
VSDQYQALILIGAARSGTKVFRDLVARHPDVDKVPYDVNYVWRLGNERVPHDELIPEWLTPNIGERILGHFEALRDGAPVLMEKTVSNCLRVRYVQAVLPDALFVHLVRDGVDVIESSYRQWTAAPKWGYVLRKALSFPLREASGYGLSYAGRAIHKLVARDRGSIGTWGPRYAGIDEDAARLDLLTVCAIQWARSVEGALHGLSAVPAGRVLTVHYEEFVREPGWQLERVAEFASLSPSFYHDLDTDLVRDDRVGRGYRNLSYDQLRLVLGRVEPLLTRLGYEGGGGAGVSVQH